MNLYSLGCSRNIVVARRLINDYITKRVWNNDYSFSRRLVVLSSFTTTKRLTSKSFIACFLVVMGPSVEVADKSVA